MGRLDGKVALVTGAGRGIGRGIALLMAQEGAAVVVNDLGTGLAGEGADVSVAQQVVNEIEAAGGKGLANTDSITDYDAVGAMVESAIDHFGKLDIVVNVAGILRDRMVFNTDEDSYHGLPEPIMCPEEPYEDLGVEDPRITRVGNQYMMVYTGYASGAGANRVRIILATSTDLVHWTKHGVLRGDFNTIDNKNGMLFEPMPDKPWRMLHRPMEGKDAMMVHWAESTHLFGEWKSTGVLLPWLPDPAFKEVWTGGGAPPLLLANGSHLVLYHIGNRDAKGKREYDLGIALVDLDAEDPVVLRAEPLMRTETPHATIVDEDLGVNNVVFICGAYFWEGDLYFPYQGSDTRILGARIVRGELDRFLNARPSLRIP